MAIAPPLLKLDRIFLTFGGRPLLDGADMTVLPDDRIALVGRNGSGKSTMLKIAAGLVEPMDGEVFRQPSATIRYLPQSPDFGTFATVRDYCLAGLGPSDDAHRVDYLLEHLGLDGHANPSTLSGGEARRAALARVMAPEPDILLLDEPTNHLDLTTIEWLEGELASIRSALILISHDRRFLEKVTRNTIWLDRGKTRRLDKASPTLKSGATSCWKKKSLNSTSSAARSSARNIGSAMALRHAASATCVRMDELAELRSRFRGREKTTGNVRMQASDGANPANW